LEARRVFLNAGARHTGPAIDGLDSLEHLTSRSILDLRQLPEHLLIVGGGYVGCEFAQMFRRFGSRLTIVQRAERLLPAEEPERSATVHEAFEAETIDVLTHTTCTSAQRTGDRVRIGCEGREREEIEGSHVLVAAGRTPNSDEFGLDELDLAPDEHGFVPVDDHLHSAVEDVWALGDLRGGPMFTHTARDDADAIYRRVYRNQERSIAGRVVPHAVFVDPEVASVGMTEQQARHAGHQLAIGRQDISGVVRARAIGETRGLIKFVVDTQSDHILGCHIAGPHAGELIHEAVVAIVVGATYGDIRHAIHIHPTLSEGINAAAGGVHRETGT
jgi:pyruvate/2-oxoglutarate dehydrogenase complex dihydrolipoamide dehydrogenase (E3) component